MKVKHASKENVLQTSLKKHHPLSGQYQKILKFGGIFAPIKSGSSVTYVLHRFLMILSEKFARLATVQLCRKIS